MALRNGCTIETAMSDFKTTGLYPFQPDWTVLKMDEFAGAYQLDKEKMDAEFAAHNADLSFAESYKSFLNSCDTLSTCITESGPTLKEQYPKGF